MNEPVEIVWFKRDLRITDHAPLLAASQSGAAVLPLYIVEPDYWLQPFASKRHWHFIHDCLIDLNSSLSRLGQPLVIKIGEASEVLKTLFLEHEISAVYTFEETGNRWTYDRDVAVRTMCTATKLVLHEYPSNGVVRNLSSRDNWSAIRNARMLQRISPKPSAITPLQTVMSDLLPDKDDPIFGTTPIGNVQKGGRGSAVADLGSFLKYRSLEYLYHISAPGLSELHCSRLSTHLTWGTLSVREVAQSIAKRGAQLSPAEEKKFGRNLTAFSSRLAWRCHFMQKIEDQPDIEIHCMHSAFEGLRVHDHNEAYYQAWATGQTGYPFIDACMRNLIAEGWITFRMRAMLVSFASYQLWLDWRVTGYHLARLFTDYEPGIHYSQLQMQSGVTGINAMRVYNPVKQSIEHDPTGAFIRKWVPELENVPTNFVHEPWKWHRNLIDDSDFTLGQDYPEPIVDQAISAKIAKQKMTEVRNSEDFRTAANAVFLKHGSRKNRPSKRRTLKVKDNNQFSLF